MGIFSPRKKQNKEGKMIGTVVPYEIHSYLSLYALMQETSKSNILKDNIEQWYNTNRQKLSKGTIIEDIVYKAKKEWQLRRANKHYPEETVNQALNEFTSELVKSLQKRGVTAGDIARIVEQFKQQTDE